jgi:predicted transcriptional regulator
MDGIGGGVQVARTPARPSVATTFKLDTDLHRRLVEEADRQRVAMIRIVEEALRQYFERVERARKKGQEG